MLKHTRKSVFAVLMTYFIYCSTGFSQVLINEVCPSNASTIHTINGEYDDWIELINTGSSPFNLQGYSLTDEIGQPNKFTFPSVEINPGEKMIVFASDVNHIPVHHYEMIVNGNGSFRYEPGHAQMDTSWRNVSFNDQSWSLGNGSVGFGDDDDATEIPISRSVMLRKTFYFADTAGLKNAIFMIDYDDGFVAYLNGHEIAKSNMPSYSNRPEWNALAVASHEAQVYQGNKPDSFFIEEAEIKSYLRIGTNVLSIEVHDCAIQAGDMTALPYLFFGMSNNQWTYPQTPAWFTTTQDRFQTSFGLKADGEGVFLLNPNGSVVDQVLFLNISRDQSYGRVPDGSSTWCYIELASPGISNNTSICYTGYAATPVVQPDGGFYSTPQLVTITVPSGSTVTYTINGDEPKITSTPYTGPIPINSTTPLSVRVFQQGKLPGPIISRNYLINEDSHLPVFTITTDSLNLWDYNTGMYVLGPNADTAFPFFNANYWQNWSKPARIEYYDKSKQRLFTFDADIEIYGNYSRARPQKSFEIKLHGYYGLSDIDYPLISDKPYVTEYDRIILRNSGTDFNHVHFRDAFMQRLMKNTFADYVAAEPVKLFLNGEQWGVYQLTEKHNHKWMKNNYDLDEDEVDYLEESGPAIIAAKGSEKSFLEMYNFITLNNPSSPTFLKEVGDRLDIRNFTDYFVAETFTNNGDWIGEWTNNIKMWKSKADSSKWRYLLFDLDYGFGLRGYLNDNRLALARNPIEFSHTSDIFDVMLMNTEYRQYFINRYADLLNTVFLESNMNSVMKQFRDSMANDMVDHFDKWGSNVNSWNARIDEMMDWAEQRQQIVRDQIKAEFNLQKQVVLTVDASPPGSGRIEISTVVPDSLPWSGIYFHGNPVTIRAIPNPGYHFNHWLSNVAITSENHSQSTTIDFGSDDHITAYFTGGPELPKLTVSEINYHSSNNYDVGDWLEVWNYGNFELDISGWTISDGDDHTKFVFPIGTSLEPNKRLVIPEDSLKFKTFFPHVANRVGELKFNLSNGSDEITIKDYNCNVHLQFQYDDGAPWPTEADGMGYTCQLSDPMGDMNNGNNWIVGCFGGSPGREHNTVLATNIDIKGANAYCIGGETSLTTLGVDGYQYQWRWNGTDIPSGINDSITVSQPGVYNLYVNYDGCSAQSPDFTVAEVEYSSTPVVSENSRCVPGAVLLSAISEDPVTWHDSPLGVTLGHGKSFSTGYISESTTYYARAGDLCPSEFVPVRARIEVGNCNPMIVYPNPISGNTLSFYQDELITGDAKIQITDMRGSIWCDRKVRVNPTGDSENFSVSLAKGLYTLTVYQNDKIYNVKIVVLK